MEKNNKKNLTQIAKQAHFSGIGRVDWNETKKEYNLSESELNYVASITRCLNSRKY